LIRTRALLRLDRTDEALNSLEKLLSTLTEGDARRTAEMLLGSAHIRRGEIGRGMEILAAADAKAATAHATIRSEIALNRALGFFGSRDLDAAECALMAVDPNSDIVFARALEYRGWIASARTDYALAAEFFLSALHYLDSCRHYDRFMEGNCVQALANLAVERLEPETWGVVATRRAKIDWSASGLTTFRFWIALNAATYAYEIDGAPFTAIREARLAQDIAPTPAAHVEALCRRAATMQRAQERLGQHDHTDAAFELFEKLDPRTFVQDDKLVPLLLAKELTISGRLEEAHKVYDIYKHQSATSPLLAVTGDPRLRAFERLVEGHMAEARRSKVGAHHAYLDAFVSLRKVGYKRRAVHAALRLGWLLNERHLFEYADETTRHLPEQSWLRRQVQKMPTDVVLLSLTPTQRDVLDLLCAGKTVEEIARTRDRSVKTIHATVTAIYKAFRVRNRTELLNELLTRRILQSP
jgi:DNA-binding CsgD family transcriptional regulator/tetratricopeptide (TPR) repeat protein